MRKNNLQISILKGIAIVSVVFGHACFWSVEFVYMYHLPLFFFVTGFLYNEEKYGNNIKMLFASRMHSIMPQYLGYTTLFLMLRNWMVEQGLYNEAISSISFDTFLQNLVGATYFGYADLVGSSFWFLPVLITAVMLYGGIISMSNKMVEKYVVIARWFGVAVVGAFGIWLIENGIVVSFHLENAFLVVPIIACGQWYKNNKNFMDDKLDWFVGIICFVCIWIVPKITGVTIELSIDEIVSPWFFYIIVLAGIYFWVFLSLKIVRVKLLAKFLDMCGRYSLDIMALHLLVVKLVDWLYLEYINPLAGDKSTFVYSVRELWPIYVATGILVPIGFRKGIESLRSLIVNGLKKAGMLKFES